MKITALGRSNYRYPNSLCCKKEAFVSAPQSMGADIFCFKGSNKLSDKIGIINSSTPTELEQNIATRLGVKPLETDVHQFKNGETYVNIKSADQVRGKDIYLMPVVTDGKVNDNLMETYEKADAAKRAGAKRVIAVMPSFYYARQEKRMENGEPITARLNMDLLRTAGVDEIITTDLHTPAIEGFAPNSMPITHLQSLEVMSDYIKGKNLKDMVVVSPDLGGTKRADALAKSLGCDKAIIYKHRQAHNVASAEDLIGDVHGKTAIIYDDMIDTAGTIAAAANMLNKNGAKEIYVCAAHGMFNGEAMTKLQQAPIKEVIVTNSLPAKSQSIPKIKYVDLSEQIAGSILKISA